MRCHFCLLLLNIAVHYAVHAMISRHAADYYAADYHAFAASITPIHITSPL